MAAAGLDQITVMDLPGGKRVATVPNPTKRRVEWVTLTPRWPLACLDQQHHER